ncbi:MAG TPA: hypothetical protein VK966_13680 [Longimicrobiales bacterium]|nr:hypothetical protein [Longimicrobiales bacterium]
MSHLTLEALARLVDEPATSEEEKHLQKCQGCRDELEALREQGQDMAALPRLLPAPDIWPSLREQLRAEGLMEGGAARKPRIRPAWRAAAAVVLFMGGGLSGYLLRGLDADTGVATVATTDASAAPVAPAAPAANAISEGTATTEAAAATASDAATPAIAAGESAVPGEGSVPLPAAGDQFQLALDQFMANTPAAEDPAARLATLNNILLITAEALNEAPTDPVINGYYRTAVAQRDAILQQIEASRDPGF